MMPITLTINDEQHSFEIPPNRNLLDLLRANGFQSVKHGCETGDCGACTVLVEGRPVPSCLLLVAGMEQQTVETLEGLGRPGALHPLQEAFVEWGGIQCGFCTPGMIMAAHALLSANPDPSEAEVREVLQGVLCRCTGYVKPVEAILAAAKQLQTNEVTA